MGTPISPPRALERVTGGFVVLRAFEDADVPQLLAAFNEPEIARWNAGPTEVDAVLRWMSDCTATVGTTTSICTAGSQTSLRSHRPAPAPVTPA